MEGERRGGFGFVFDQVEHRHAQRGADILRNFAWVGCLVCAAPTVLGMFLEIGFLQIGRPSGAGAKLPVSERSVPPSPALPINGIDGEGERGDGFNKVLNHFEGRR